MEERDFANDLIQSVHVRAEVSGTYFEDAFFEVCAEYLVEAGELEEAHRAFFDNNRGTRVDGFGGDPWELDGKLSLVVTDPDPAGDDGNLTKTDMEKLFKRLTSFMEGARSSRFKDTLAESTEAWQLADLIDARWERVNEVRLILVTNRPISARVDRKEAGEVAGTPISYSVWDLSRLHRLALSGVEREPLKVDFEGEFGSPVPALKADVDEAGYSAYLAVLPAEQLAAVYDKWGARLLEQNVRVFLQARSKVNKGIRNTLEQEPHMFFAFNNGIAATAEAVEVENRPDGLVITRVENLQIVNGGQTTASIHRAGKLDGRDLSNVSVQMKLAVVDPEEVREVVPRISRYANSQNKISEADFFSNHPFHVRVEEMSRRIYAPAAPGSFKETLWFYERARGQYNDAKAYLGRAKRNEFVAQHPAAQVFRKTDLAKFENVWRQLPQVVSLGAQKNFANFAEHVAAKWEADASQFNDRYFRHLVAKAIVFRATERLVSKAAWYPGGFRANIVAYSLGRMALAFASLGLEPDLDAIWDSQSIPDEFDALLNDIGPAVTAVLESPPAGIANVTEWAKKPACWEEVQKIDVDEASVRSIGVSVESEKTERRRAKKERKVVDGIEAQLLVHAIGPEQWGKMLQWAKLKRLLGPKSRDILEICSRPDGSPSEKQCAVAIEAMLSLHEEGCLYGREELARSSIR